MMKEEENCHCKRLPFHWSRAGLQWITRFVGCSFVCLFVCYHAENGLIHCFDDIVDDGHLKWYHCGVHEVVQPGGEVLVQSHREDQVPGSQDCNLIILFTNNLDLDVMFRPFML